MPTYAEIQAEIQRLQHEAEMLRKNELNAVINDIKAKIAEFNLTARDLGLDGAAAKRSRSGKPRAASVGKPRFAGPDGQTWSGFGRQPQWLRDALAAGKSKDDFAL